MSSIIFSTETTCDKTRKELLDENIISINLKTLLDGEMFETDTLEEISSIYKAMRNGNRATTSQVNEAEAEEYFEMLLKKGRDILHLSISSGVSGNFNTLSRVAERLNKTSKNKIYVVDTLCGSGEQYILIKKVKNKFEKENSGIDDLIKFVKEEKKKMICFLTVDDLKFLHQGGRLSKASCIIGNALQIKPILVVDNEGKMAVVQKTIGRRFALANLFTRIREGYLDDGFEVQIAHADALEEAESLKEKIETKLGIKASVHLMSPILGIHAGPGSIDITFTTMERKF